MHDIEAKSLLTRWNSMNLYRGCTHGCIYCDSRSRCYQFTHPFEDVAVKRNAPDLLEDILRTKRKPVMIGTGSMSDPYQPCEETLRLTRRCLELIHRYGFGASVITKSDRVLRDRDLFADIHQRAKSVLQMTLTVADDDLSRILEPNVSPSSRRYVILKAFQERGVPTVVWLSPFLPFLTDTEENFDQLMDWCLDAGVRGIVCFGIGMTLREGNREYYYQVLDRYFPGVRARYQKTYGDAYELSSPNHTRLMAKFHSLCEQYGILHDPEACFAWMRKMPEDRGQMSLF